MIDILDYRTIGKKDDGSIVLMTTNYVNREDHAVSSETILVNNSDIIPVLVRKINELSNRLNDFHGINE